MPLLSGLQAPQEAQVVLWSHPYPQSGSRGKGLCGEPASPPPTRGAEERRAVQGPPPGQKRPLPKAMAGNPTFACPSAPPQSDQ